METHTNKIETASTAELADVAKGIDADLTTHSWCIEPAQEGQRIDAVLNLYFPETSLRTRRRLCESGAVWLTKRPASAAVKVRAGQILSVTIPAAMPCVSLPSSIQALDRDFPANTAEDTPLEIVYQDADFMVIYKPVGLHTIALSGSSTPSLEGCIRRCCANITLLTRLDKETSGFVVGAFSEKAIDTWRLAEGRGKVEKTYMAIVEGTWPEAYILSRSIDTANRRVSRVRNADTPDQRRHTYVEPVKVFEAGMCPYLDTQYPQCTTLVSCRILQGSRHQIRAHLAAAGHPLVYDTLYGSRAESLESVNFILRNVKITSPFFEVKRDF